MEGEIWMEPKRGITKIEIIKKENHRIIKK
jgi:hypothetical protein